MGDLIVDTHPLTVQDVAAGEYALNVGLYNPVDGARVQVLGSTQEYADTVTLTGITLAE